MMMTTTDRGTETETQEQLPEKEINLHALDPRRKGVLIMGNLTMALTATAVAVSLAATGTSAEKIIALNVTAILTTLLASYILLRLGKRVMELEFWIRRMGAGDLEYTVAPKGHDEITEITYDLEVMRERSIRSQELDVVRQLSEELQDKNETLESTLVELHNTQDQVVSKQKLAEIGELAAGIAHEVRNPLNIISNFSATSRSLMEELLEIMAEEDADPDERAQDIAEITGNLTSNMTRIAENCDRASNIIQDVTNMSRGQASAPRPVQFNKLLHDYAMLTYQATRAQDNDFNVSFVEQYDDTVGEVVCVPEEISRVFINIAQNACYATNEKVLDPETPEDYRPTIWLSTSRNGNNVTASIRDNGNGIPDAVAEKMFNPFFTTKPTNEGTGLGLSLSYDIVRHHGGTIEVQTETGQFTEMRVALPVRATMQVAEEDQ